MHFNFWAPASNKVIARGSLLRRILIWPRDASVDQCDQMLETSSLILSKIFPKNSRSSFYSKVMFFKMAQKSQNILDTIVRKFVTKIRPIWSHCERMGQQDWNWCHKESTVIGCCKSNDKF